MDGGAWWATIHGVAKSWTRLSDFSVCVCVCVCVCVDQTADVGSLQGEVSSWQVNPLGGIF